MKNKIIKLTEKQLREAEGDAFQYIDSEDDMIPFNGQSEISVSGKLDNNDDGIPLTSDDVANIVTPQSYVRYRAYGNVRNMREGVDINKDDVDDFYNRDELDTLSNGNINDNLTKIPAGVDTKVNILLDALNNLTDKQQAIVLNKVIESLEINSIPHSWKKELCMKIMSKNKQQ